MTTGTTELLFLHGHKAARKRVIQSADGDIRTVANYPNIAVWQRRPVTISPDIDALADALKSAANTGAILVSGLPIDLGTRPDAYLPRLKHSRENQPATIAEAASPWLAVDIDKTQVSAPLDPLDPEAIITELAERLGTEFAACSYVWQLTASAKPGSRIVSVRLFFLTSQPITNTQRKRWALALNDRLGVKLVDPAIYQCAQPIYIAPPAFDVGVDPFPQRFGVVYGEVETLEWSTIEDAIPEQRRHGGQYQGTTTGYAVSGSIADRLAAIGDHTGGAGIHAPIRDAIMQMVREKWPTERIIPTIQAYVAEADTSGHDPAYVASKITPRAIRQSIDGAAIRLKAEEKPLRAKQTATNAPTVSLAQGRRMIREAVEQWRDGETKPVVVIRSTVGAGKTSATVGALRGKSVLWFAPNHHQGAEVLEAFNRDRPDTIPLARPIRGRLHQGADGQTLCQRPQVIEAIKQAHLTRHTATIACERDGHVCPHRRDCAYFRQFAEVAPIRILPHAYMTLSGARALKLPESDHPFVGAVIDESPLGTLVGHGHRSTDKVLAVGGHLAQFVLAVRDRLPIDEPAMEAALTVEFEERCKPDLPVSGPSERDAWALAAELGQMASEYNHNHGRGLAGLYSAALNWLQGQRNTLWFGKTGTGTEAVFYAWKRLPAFAMPDGSPARLLILDATADETVYRALFGDDLEFVDIRVGQNLEIIRVTDKALGKGRVVATTEGPDGKEQHQPGEFLPGVVALARATGSGLITHKAGIETARALGWLGDTPTAHFGALRGVNHMAGCSSLVIAGRPEPDAIHTEATARALWPNASLSLTGEYQYRLDGAVSVACHPDARVDAVLRMHREGEIEQAIGRLRAVSATSPKRVYVVTNTPIEHPAQEVALSEILPDAKLARLLLAFNGAAPLIPRIMAARLPDVWASEQAAKDWVRQKRPEKGGSLLIEESLYKATPTLFALTGHAPLTAFVFRAEGQRGSNPCGVSWYCENEVTRTTLAATIHRNIPTLAITDTTQPHQYQPTEAPAMQTSPITLTATKPDGETVTVTTELPLAATERLLNRLTGAWAMVEATAPSQTKTGTVIDAADRFTQRTVTATS